PVDVLRAPVAPRSLAGPPNPVRSRPSPVDEESVLALGQELDAARCPVFLIGEGAAEAVDSIMVLVQLTGALFVTTPSGKGLINPAHPAYRGVFGLAGHASAHQLLQGQPDLVVAFGTTF